MKNFTNSMVAVVALQHFAFLVLEMFYWNKALGMKVFKLNQQFANESHGLAMNQGLYNGFLAAGLVWSLVASSADMSFQLKVFFLSCVVTAAIFGALTVGRTILFVQGTPAFIALVLVFFSLKS